MKLLNKKTLKKVAVAFIALTIALAAYFKFMAFQSQRMEPQIGIENGHLRLCGPKPNCVSTLNTDPEHSFEPVNLDRDPAIARQTLEQIGLARGGIVKARTETYLHMEFKTKRMGYVDDVEFLIDPTALAIECRSGSRVGHSDMGTNRVRLTALIAEYRRR